MWGFWIVRLSSRLLDDRFDAKLYKAELSSDELCDIKFIHYNASTIIFHMRCFRWCCVIHMIWYTLWLDSLHDALFILLYRIRTISMYICGIHIAQFIHFSRYDTIHAVQDAERVLLCLSLSIFRNSVSVSSESQRGKSQSHSDSHKCDAHSVVNLWQNISSLSKSISNQ